MITYLLYIIIFLIIFNILLVYYKIRSYKKLNTQQYILIINYLDNLVKIYAGLNKPNMDDIKKYYSTCVKEIISEYISKDMKKIIKLYFNSNGLSLYILNALRNIT